MGAKKQRGQVPRDSVLSSGAASTRERERGRGRQERGGERWAAGELISSTHAHGAALRVPRDSPGIPHNIPSSSPEPPAAPPQRARPNPTGRPLYLLAVSAWSQLYRPTLQDFPASPRRVKIKTVLPVPFSLPFSLLVQLFCTLL